MRLYWKTVQTLGSAALRFGERTGFAPWTGEGTTQEMETATEAPHKEASREVPKEKAAEPCRFLERERAAMERFLPGLDEKLAGFHLEELECPGNPGIQLLKECRGPNLLVPKRYGGLGATPVEGLRVLRAIASRSPSLGVVSTMHNFSMCSFVAYADASEAYRILLLHVTGQASLLASGFAEGRSGARPLDMAMKARTGPLNSWILSGSKKPCTLSQSMDFLTAGVAATDDDGELRRAVALIPADSPGIERRPFWKSKILAGAESDEVILNDVIIPKHFLAFNERVDGLDAMEELGYLWLQLALSATYVGVGSALVERVVRGKRGNETERLAVVSELESAMCAIEGVARGLMDGEDISELLARVLSVRVAAQASLERASMRAAELLGGMAFIGANDVSYLLSATRALAFHPPGRLHVASALDGYLRGAKLDLA